jgi:6-phosphogluconolactonase/glucosamine-6-phosphate isomerase/deaminase
MIPLFNMSLNIKTTNKTEEAASFIALSVLNQLKLGKRVLFFVTGGSSIAVGVKVAEILRKNEYQDLIQNLTITLTDERYGPTDHFNSNYFQLVEKGFSLPQAKIIPILIDDDRNITTEKFNTALNQEFTRVEYKIGLFGIGVDGHTAGILPESEAVNSGDLAYSYDTPVFSRITITPKAIEKLDEAIVWAQGEDKWKVIKDLNENIDIVKQPAQILKKVPLLTIFTDYKNI